MTDRLHLTAVAEVYCDERRALGLPAVEAVAALPADALPGVLAHLAALQTAVAARLVASEARTTRPANATCAAHRTLTVREAADRLGMSVDWLYRHASGLPFTRRVGRRSLRFDANALDRWIASRGR